MKSHYNQRIADSVIEGGLIIRGTNAWDDREKLRRAAGCKCLSFGTLHDSILTKGKSAQYDPRDLI